MAADDKANISDQRTFYLSIIRIKERKMETFNH